MNTPECKESDNNYFKTPNGIIDSIMPSIGTTDTCVLLVVLRQTIGWHKKKDAISYSFFCKKTGIKSRSTISQSIQNLENLGLITVTRTPNHTSIYEYTGVQEIITEDMVSIVVDSKDSITEDDKMTSPDNEPVDIHDQSNFRTPSSPESEPVEPKTSPVNGHTKDIPKEIKKTSSSSTLKRYLLSLDKELIFTQSFYHEAEIYIQQNHMDYKYCDWLYAIIKAKKNVSSITGYFYKIFFEENMRTLYRETNEKITTKKIGIPCPICDCVSTSNISCTSCGVSFIGLTDKKIKRERALRKLPENLLIEYSNKYQEITKKYMFGPLFNKELAKLDEMFQIPIITE